MVELDEAEEKTKELKADLLQILSWSEIFDGSDLETKKMIANYMIKRITVYECYKLDVEMNMNVQQFLNCLEESARHKAAS